MSLLRYDFDHRPPTVSHGAGARLYDEIGRDYLDGSSGAIVANIGHGVPEIAAAAAEQMKMVAFTYRTQFSSRPADELAERLVRLAGDKQKAFFLNSGSEANEAAIRLVLQYWMEQGRSSKRRILSRRISYHGNTLGALSISSDARRQAISRLTIEEPVVAQCYCYRCPFRRSPESCEVDCAKSLEETILQIGAENIAAFFVEPIVGATGGGIVPHRSYFERVREICDRYEILLVVDEVITGLGRTGKWFAMQHWGVSSDITVLGKGLNAGYTPLSALLLGKRVMDVLEAGTRRVSIGHTHSCSPGSTAICNAVVRYIEDNRLVEAAATNGAALGEELRALQKRHPIIGDVRGVGMLWGLEFVDDHASRRLFASGQKITDRIVQTAFSNRLIVYPCRGLVNASQGDAILVAPPLNINAEERATLLNRLDATLGSLETTLRAA
jgi:adenosylmethionine-8-amino-7-oxononanoate aminotransferase